MSKNKTRKTEINTDEEIRNLVIARLNALSPDTMKSIGDEGVFTRDELINNVQKGNKIGRTIEAVEMEWIRAMKTGLIQKLYGQGF